MQKIQKQNQAKIAIWILKKYEEIKGKTFQVRYSNAFTINLSNFFFQIPPQENL